MKKKSILFVTPDYHCSFFYRDILRKRGWKCDIFVPSNYPLKLLYSEEDIIYPSYKGKNKFVIVFFSWINLIKFLFKYKTFIIYSATYITPLIPDFLDKLISKKFRLDLFIYKLFKKKIIYIPSGCLDTDLKSNILGLDNGNICNNCGYSNEVCTEEKGIRKFSILRNYVDKFLLMYPDIISKSFNGEIIKYKSLDLNLWNPDIKIPNEFKLPSTKKLRILHSFFKENRENNGKNIKGSPFIVEAINRLKSEGFEVEYFYINDVESKNMRYYQAQADIVVEQLIYGWWGSTGLECMALGKPVICYLREDAKQNFFEKFPEYENLPIIEANTLNIYEVLKKVVVDKDYRVNKANESRKFAESFFDIEKNVINFEQIIKNTLEE